MRIYIAGRVSGQPREQSERNFARGIKALVSCNYEPVNPLDLVKEGATHREAMKILIPAMLECDGILLLNDHIFSEGARLEEDMARYCKMLIFYEDDLC